MKRLLPFVAAASIVALSLPATAESLESGKVDFGDFSALKSGGKFVEINIGRALIGLATRFIPEDQADLANILNGLHGIEVRVVGVTDDNRPALEKRTQEVRKYIDNHGWDHVVSAHNGGHDADIYLKMENQDTVAGLAVVAMDSNKEAVFINIVGNIKPDQLATVGEQLGIDPLKKFGKAAPKEGDNR